MAKSRRKPKIKTVTRISGRRKVTCRTVIQPLSKRGRRRK